MNLEKHYDSLYTASIKKILDDTYEIDGLINASSDNRFGLTLLIRPSTKIKNNIQEFLNKLKTVEPNQYYYDNSDIYITAMSIISCYNGFQLKDIDLSEYIKTIKKSLADNTNIKITFKGITASPSCIMVQGFMNNSSLNSIRNNLREHFKNTNLQQSIDQRYAIQTAHSTVVRFSEKLTNKSKYLELINDYINHGFGTFKADTLELVYNDWYQKKEHVKKLFEFNV